MSSITTRSGAGTSPTATSKSSPTKRAAKPGPQSPPATPTRGCNRNEKSHPHHRQINRVWHRNLPLRNRQQNRVHNLRQGHQHGCNRNEKSRPRHRQINRVRNLRQIRSLHRNLQQRRNESSNLLQRRNRLRQMRAADVGDESSTSSLQLSVSAAADLPAGDESKESTELSVSANDDFSAIEPLVEVGSLVDSQGVKSVSGSSTATETSGDEAKDPSYPEAPQLANIILQSQTTVPPAVPRDPPSPVRSKLKEIKYWSSKLEKPYFLHKTDRFDFPHYQFPALPEHTQHFEPTDKMGKQYDEYFANLSTNPLPENQIVCRIGKTPVNVISLNTLQPAGWLNDTILTAYLDLLGNEVYAQNKEDKNPPKMAVFDSHFLNNLGASNDEYNYKNSRGSARKRLRGRCPSDFEVLLFFATKIFNTISIWLSTPGNG
jgi:hypothetical protein